MQHMIARGRSLGMIAIIVLLSIQGILGLLVSLPWLADLLAPGRPVIVTGAAIFTGPAAGIALGVALASPISAWGLWMRKRWAPQRTVLLEILSLGVGVPAFTAPDINRGLLFTNLAMAVLILLCWSIDPSVRALSHT